jgi:hypothetical protein
MWNPRKSNGGKIALVWEDKKDFACLVTQCLVGASGSEVNMASSGNERFFLSLRPSFGCLLLKNKPFVRFVTLLFLFFFLLPKLQHYPIPTSKVNRKEGTRTKQRQICLLAFSIFFRFDFNSLSLSLFFLFSFSFVSDQRFQIEFSQGLRLSTILQEDSLSFFSFFLSLFLLNFSILFSRCQLHHQHNLRT